MKLQELNHEEAREINGGLLGLFGNNDSQSSGGLMGGLGIHFSNESKDEGTLLLDHNCQLTPPL